MASAGQSIRAVRSFSHATCGIPAQFRFGRMPVIQSSLGQLWPPQSPCHAIAVLIVELVHRLFFLKCLKPTKLCQSALSSDWLSIESMTCSTQPGRNLQIEKPGLRIWHAVESCGVGEGAGRAPRLKTWPPPPPPHARLGLADSIPPLFFLSYLLSLVLNALRDRSG